MAFTNDNIVISHRGYILKGNIYIINIYVYGQYDYLNISIGISIGGVLPK